MSEHSGKYAGMQRSKILMPVVRHVMMMMQRHHKRDRSRLQFLPDVCRLTAVVGGSLYIQSSESVTCSNHVLISICSSLYLSIWVWVSRWECVLGQCEDLCEWCCVNVVVSANGCLCVNVFGYVGVPFWVQRERCDYVCCVCEWVSKRAVVCACACVYVCVLPPCVYATYVGSNVQREVWWGGGSEHPLDFIWRWASSWKICIDLQLRGGSVGYPINEQWISQDFAPSIN